MNGDASRKKDAGVDEGGTDKKKNTQLQLQCTQFLSFTRPREMWQDGRIGNKKGKSHLLPANKDAENRQQLYDAHETGVGKDRRIQTERVKQQLCRSREK